MVSRQVADLAAAEQRVVELRARLAAQERDMAPNRAKPNTRSMMWPQPYSSGTVVAT
jgi:hypothetical protein